MHLLIDPDGRIRLLAHTNTPCCVSFIIIVETHTNHLTMFLKVGSHVS